MGRSYLIGCMSPLEENHFFSSLPRLSFSLSTSSRNVPGVAVSLYFTLFISLPLVFCFIIIFFIFCRFFCDGRVLFLVLCIILPTQSFSCPGKYKLPYQINAA